MVSFANIAKCAALAGLTGAIGSPKGDLSLRGGRNMLAAESGSASRLLWVMSGWKEAADFADTGYPMQDHLSELTSTGLASDVMVGWLEAGKGDGVKAKGTVKPYHSVKRSSRKNMTEYYKDEREARLWITYAPTPEQLSKYALDPEEQAEAVVEYFDHYNFNGGVVVDVREEQLVTIKKNLEYFGAFIEGLQDIRPSLPIGVLIGAEMLNKVQRQGRGTLLTGRTPTSVADPENPPITMFVYYRNSKYNEKKVETLYQAAFGTSRAISIPELAGVKSGLGKNPHARRFVFARAIIDETSAQKIKEVVEKAETYMGYDSGVFLVDKYMPYPDDSDYSDFLSNDLPLIAGATSGGKRPKSLYDTTPVKISQDL